jgi:hypothetical protein
VLPQTFKVFGPDQRLHHCSDLFARVTLGLCAVQNLIISRAEAKKRKIQPACEADAFPVCDSFIAGGLKSCKVDYCEICPEAHSCDHTCDLPCAGGANQGANGAPR